MHRKLDAEDHPETDRPLLPVSAVHRGFNRCGSSMRLVGKVGNASGVRQACVRRASGVRLGGARGVVEHAAPGLCPRVRVSCRQESRR